MWGKICYIEVMTRLKNFLQIRFQPSVDLLVVFVSFFVMIAGLYVAWRTFTIVSAWVPVSMFVLGIAIPIAYNSFIKKRPLSEIGISKKFLLISLIIGFILSVFIFVAPSPENPSVTLVVAIKSLTFIELLPLLALEITAGLFWVIFFNGWVQIRFESAFGAIPAILAAAAFFALHHVGYGESISPSHMAPLFMAGIINSVIFRITRNIFILWPFFIATTGLSADLIQWNLRLPFESIFGYFGVLALMWLFIITIYWQQKKKEAIE